MCTSDIVIIKHVTETNRMQVFDRACGAASIGSEDETRNRFIPFLFFTCFKIKFKPDFVCSKTKSNKLLSLFLPIFQLTVKKLKISFNFYFTFKLINNNKTLYFTLLFLLRTRKRIVPIKQRGKQGRSQYHCSSDQENSQSIEKGQIFPVYKLTTEN